MVQVEPKSAEEIRRCWAICNTPGSRCRGEDNRLCSMYDVDCERKLAEMAVEAGVHGKRA